MVLHFIGEIVSKSVQIEKICEFCGSLFTAQKLTTRYCSHLCNSRAYKANIRNSKIEENKNQTALILEQKPIKELQSKEILTISETAIFIGVSRPTVYNYLRNGELNSICLGYKTFIRRSDIDALFTNFKPYQARPKKDRKPITEFYSIKEVMETFGIKESYVYQIIKKNIIPKVLNRGRVYYSKSHVDAFFKTKGFEENQKILEWYTVPEICEKYRLTNSAIYSFVYKNKIPRKKENNVVFYSRKHFDEAKNRLQIPVQEYYTTEMAMNKYNLTRDSLYWYLRSNNIPRVKEGKYVKISKPDLDQLFEKQIIP